MTAKIISGTQIASKIREEVKEETARLKEERGITPGLVTIIVGRDPASISYVTGKQKTAKELGFYSVQEDVSEDVSEAALLELIGKYNSDPKIHGILVQLPLPKHINETKVLYAIDPDKDVDGFHPVNVGRLMIGEAKFYPCTPYGIQQMLIRSGITIDGAEVVVVGRSNDARAKSKRRERDSHHMPHGYKRYCLPYEAGRHSHRCRGKTQGDNGRYGKGRGRRYRCRGQQDRDDPGRKGKALRRCRF